MMGIFSSIKNAVWGSDEDEKAAAAPKPAAAPAAPKPAAPAAHAASSTPDPISQEEMEARIAAIPDSDKYNWKTSIVDLMKMVGLDPSFANRKELAEELGMEGYSGTAEENINLHHAVLNTLAAEGGAVGGILKY
jgi:3-oxoacyl-ACP reductase-like protein